MIEAARLGYRLHGIGAPRDAKRLISQLRGIADAELSLEQRDICTFLLAEALDAVQGGGAALKELERHWKNIGHTPLVAVGVAERMVRRNDLAAALHFYERAVGGRLQAMRAAGAIALKAADVARSMGRDESARRLLELARLERDSRATAEERLEHWFSGGRMVRDSEATLMVVGEDDLADGVSDYGDEAPGDDDSQVFEASAFRAEFEAELEAQRSAIPAPPPRLALAPVQNGAGDDEAPVRDTLASADAAGPGDPQAPGAAHAPATADELGANEHDEAPARLSSDYLEPLSEDVTLLESGRPPDDAPDADDAHDGDTREAHDAHDGAAHEAHDAHDGAAHEAHDADDRPTMASELPAREPPARAATLASATQPDPRVAPVSPAALVPGAPSAPDEQPIGEAGSAYEAPAELFAVGGGDDPLGEHSPEPSPISGDPARDGPDAPLGGFAVDRPEAAPPDPLPGEEFAESSRAPHSEWAPDEVALEPSHAAEDDTFTTPYEAVEPAREPLSSGTEFDLPSAEPSDEGAHAAARVEGPEVPMQDAWVAETDTTLPHGGADDDGFTTTLPPSPAPAPEVRTPAPHHHHEEDPDGVQPTLMPPPNVGPFAPPGSSPGIGVDDAGIEAALDLIAPGDAASSLDAAKELRPQSDGAPLSGAAPEAQAASTPRRQPTPAVVPPADVVTPFVTLPRPPPPPAADVAERGYSRTPTDRPGAQQRPVSERPPPSSVPRMRAEPTTGKVRRRLSAPELPEVHTKEESQLLDALLEGSPQAAEALYRRYLGEGATRSRDALRACQLWWTTSRGDTRALRELRGAAERDCNSAYARALDQVLFAFDSRAPAVDPPGLGELVVQPELTTRLVFSGLSGGINEALGIVCETGKFRRELGDYRLSGADRVPAGTPTAVGLVYSQLLSLLDIGAIRLFHQQRSGPLSGQVVLLSPLAAVLQGSAERDSPVLRYVVADALASAMPQCALVLGLPPEQLRSVLGALAAGFGPVGAAADTTAEQMRLADDFWHLVPAAAGRRLHQIYQTAAEVSYDAAFVAARRACRRAGLFAAGDLATAVGRTLEELELANEAPLGDAEILPWLYRLPEVADLVDLATRPEYAEARWRRAR